MSGAIIAREGFQLQPYEALQNYQRDLEGPNCRHTVQMPNPADHLAELELCHVGGHKQSFSGYKKYRKKS